MNALDGKKPMMNFLRKTALWILLAPYAVFGLGAASNQAVLIANHDKFPVMVNARKLDAIMSRDAVEKLTHALGMKSNELATKPADLDGMIDDVHCVMTKHTHLNALADVFDFGSIYSIGDFGLYLGEWLMVWTPFVWTYAVIDKLRKSE